MMKEMWRIWFNEIFFEEVNCVFQLKQIKSNSLAFKDVEDDFFCYKISSL